MEHTTGRRGFQDADYKVMHPITCRRYHTEQDAIDAMKDNDIAFETVKLIHFWQIYVFAEYGLFHREKKGKPWTLLKTTLGTCVADAQERFKLAFNRDFDWPFYKVEQMQ